MRGRAPPSARPCRVPPWKRRPLGSWPCSPGRVPPDTRLSGHPSEPWPLTRCRGSRDPAGEVARFGQAKRVGARRSRPRCSSVPWRPEDSAQVLGAGNSASPWVFSITTTAALPGWPPGGICSAKQIEMYLVLDCWQQGWVLTALGAVNRNQDQALFYRKIRTKFPHPDMQASGSEGLGPRDTPFSVHGHPRAQKCLDQGHTASSREPHLHPRSLAKPRPGLPLVCVG